MKKLAAILMFVTAAACGGGEKPAPNKPDPDVAKPDPVTPDPEPAKPATPPPFELALGELVIYDGAEPGFKLHADGTSEVSAKVTKTTGKGKKAKTTTTTEWKAGPTFKSDGTIEIEGKAMGKVGWDGVTDLASGQVMLTYKLDGDTLTVKAADGSDVKLELVPEGVKVVGGPMDGRVDKIEATDDKVKRTALILIAVNSAGGGKEPPAAESGAKSPAK